MCLPILYAAGGIVIVLNFSAGILTFLVLEKIFEYTEDEKEESNNNKKGGDLKQKKIIGYLNLLANCIDNFIHGLTVASRCPYE